ncbi:hypothetical protein QE152_g35718 [Popillia japonica]|uniref:Uncharacterized protein n=1 Tax=Popillia japonica TaxID=7064 RepID=A0AAW1IF59_POPJA
MVPKRRRLTGISFTGAMGLGLTASLNPNGVGLENSPNLDNIGKPPKIEFATSQVNLSQESGQCYTTLKSPTNT